VPAVFVPNSRVPAPFKGPRSRGIRCRAPLRCRHDCGRRGPNRTPSSLGRRSSRRRWWPSQHRRKRHRRLSEESRGPRAMRRSIRYRSWRIRRLGAADGAHRANRGCFIRRLTRTQKRGNRYGRDDADDRHHHHQFDQREAVSSIDAHVDVSRSHGQGQHSSQPATFLTSRDHPTECRNSENSCGGECEA